MQTNQIGQIAEIQAIGEGNSWITEAKPTCYRTFTKQRPLVGSQTEADFTEWTDAEKAAWEAKPPKPAERNDATALYEAAGAKLNEATGYYEMHDGAIVDLTEEDMAKVAACGFPPAGAEWYYCLNWQTGLRTNAKRHGPNRASFNNTWQNCRDLEVFYASCMIGGNNTFDGCVKLRHIKHFNYYSNQMNNNAFARCTALTRVELQPGVNCGANFADSPLIDVESLTYMANSCLAPDAEHAATIKLHPKAYARLTDEIIEAATQRFLTFQCASEHVDGSPYTDEELA